MRRRFGYDRWGRRCGREVANEAGNFGKVTSIPTDEQARNAAGNFGTVKWLPTTEQAANEASLAPVVDQAKALQNSAKEQAFANQRARTQLRMQQRNSNQIDQAKTLAYEKIKQALGNE